MHKRNKYLSVHTKTEHKKPHNNRKSVSLWWYIFKELWDFCVLLGCATVRALETEVINHTWLQTAFIVTDIVQKQKTAHHTAVSYTAKYFLKVSTHWKFCAMIVNIINFYILQLQTREVWLLELSYRQRYQAQGGHMDNFQTDTKGSLASSTCTDSMVAEVLGFSHFFKNQNM